MAYYSNNTDYNREYRGSAPPVMYRESYGSYVDEDEDPLGSSHKPDWMPNGQNEDRPHRSYKPHDLPSLPPGRYYPHGLPRRRPSPHGSPRERPSLHSSSQRNPSPEKSEGETVAAKLRTKMEAERIKRETEEKKLAALMEEEKYESESKRTIAALMKLLEDSKNDAERYKKMAEERTVADRNACGEAAAKAATDAKVKEAVEKAEAEAGSKKIKPAEEAKAKAEKEKKAAEEARPKAEEEKTALAAPQDDTMKFIKFKDAVGRKFIFPFRFCQTWAKMENLIKQISLPVKHIQPAVNAGYYDLIGPNNEIILPQVWDEVIKPDWTITMLMWPVDRWVGDFKGTPIYNPILQAVLDWVFWPIERARTRVVE